MGFALLCVRHRDFFMRPVAPLFVFGLILSSPVFARPNHAGCQEDLGSRFGGWIGSVREGLWHGDKGTRARKANPHERVANLHVSNQDFAYTGATELSPEERAALATIRYAEGADYDRLFGWFENKSRVFDPMTQVGHPNSPYTSSGGTYTSTAAGAYQAILSTWNEEVEKGTISNDFTPANQDRFAIARLAYRGLLDEVRDGNTAWIDSVEMGREWASFPNSPYGQPTHTSSNLRSYYYEQLRTFQLLN